VRTEGTNIQQKYFTLQKSDAIHDGPFFMKARNGLRPEATLAVPAINWLPRLPYWAINSVTRLWMPTPGFPVFITFLLEALNQVTRLTV